MFETTGKITQEVLDDILKYRRPKFRTVMLWIIFIVGLAYIIVALFLQDWFGAAMAAFMAYLGYYALFIRPKKWMKTQQEAMRKNNSEWLEYKTSYENDCIRIFCMTNGWKGTLAYSNFKRGLETDKYIVLFTFKDEYIVTFKRQLTPYEQEKLKEHLKKKLPKKFKWTRWV